MISSDYQQRFIDKATKVHGGKYDYSLVKYENAHKCVDIICRIHGIFKQNPNNHLNGQGCPSCRYHKVRKLNYGVGVYDYHKSISHNSKEYVSYKKWNAMLERCYSEKLHLKHPTYIGCSVCDDWLVYSNFKRWFDENYIEGYHLDKDILCKGNKIYSPDTCCFVPHEINTLIIKSDAKRGDFPIGVTMHNGVSYLAQTTFGRKHITIGIYHSVGDAFNAYKAFKENYIKEVATAYFKEGKIKQNVYEALMNYEVSITD